MTFKDILAGTIYGVKNALGLGQTNLIKGADVNKALTGVPATQVYGGAGNNVTSQNITPLAQKNVYNGKLGVPQTGALYPKVLGATDQVGGVGSGSGSSGGSGDGGGDNGGSGLSDAELAQMQYDNAVKRINELFGIGKQQVENERTNANTRFQNILDAVNAFKTRAGELKANSAQEITNQGANIANTNAVNAQGLVGKAVGQARGLGLGLSSRINLGQGLMKELAARQGDVLAKIGEQNRSNDVLFNQRIDTGEDTLREAQLAKDEALRNADIYDRTNIANYGANEEQAGLDFNQLINNITNYNRQLAAIKGPDAGTLTNYTPNFSGLNSVSTPSINTGGGFTAGPAIASNLANPVNTLDQIKKRIGLYYGVA